MKQKGEKVDSDIPANPEKHKAMKIIIPMAGMGKRMRPHTLSVPKPLIRLAGKTIVQRLTESIAASVSEKIDEIAFIIGDFGEEVESDLLAVAEKAGAQGRIYYQEEPLGTAHAIHCAAPSLEGPVVIAFADTLFKADFALDTEKEAVIWIKSVEDPSAFGVVLTREDGQVQSFAEKPDTFVSDKAIIGIYYFKEGLHLKQKIKALIDRDHRVNGEYQLTDVLQEMLDGGMPFYTTGVEEWLDCGNKDATVQTHQRILEHEKDLSQISPQARIIDSVITPPCYIAAGAHIAHSIIGPHVSIEQNTRIEHSVITNAIIQQDTRIRNANFDNSMVGSAVDYKGSVNEVSLGDYSVIH